MPRKTISSSRTATRKTSKRRHSSATAQQSKSSKTPRAATTVTTDLSRGRRLLQRVRHGLASLNKRRHSYLRRRPHRSFRLTRRRDYKRSFQLPGYFAFTLETASMLWRHKATFTLLGVCFFVLYIVFNLMGSQDNYQKFHDLLYGTAPDSLFSGIAGDIGKAGILLFTTVTQGINNTPDTGQKFIAAFIGVYIWLAIIWLLRNMMAGRKVGVRDGLYNAGSPIIPMILLVVTFLVQLIPLAIAVIISTAAYQSGFLEQGAWAMLAAIGLVLIITISLYWVTSTLIAMVVVTLPGMYPMRALAIAGDLVVGRRLRLVYRFIWMILTVISWWVVIMIPVILFDNWIKSVYEAIAWLPIVPVMLLVMSTFTLFWSATYTYLLYRKMVDDDASPA